MCWVNASFPSPSRDATLQPPHQVMHFLKGTYLNIPTIFPSICSYIIVSEVFHDSLNHITNFPRAKTHSRSFLEFPINLVEKLGRLSVLSISG